MAPRNTRNGAAATARRTTPTGRTRASSSSRSSAAAARAPRRSWIAGAFGATARLADVIPLRPEFAGVRPRAASGPARRAAAGPACSETPGRWWVMPAAVLAILGVFAFAYYPVVRVQYREYRERARLAAELEALQQRNARLETEVARLRTPEGVEDYARTQLGLVKRGEHVVVVRDGSVPAEPKPANTAAVRTVPEIDSDRTAEAPVGPWTAFLDLVFGVQ